MAGKETKITRPLARADSVVVESVGDELVIYDLDSHVAHALTPLAAAVFTYADGKNTATEIAELASYRLAEAITEAQVADAISQLDQISLLKSPLLDVHSGLSRRQALKTFAAAGAGSMLVLSVATSAASACVTCTTVPSNGSNTCTKNSVGNAGPGDCRLCTSASQCGSDSVCCCAPCDGASNDCCQPVCFYGKTCPSGTLPLTKAAGTGGILCPTGYGFYDKSGYLVKCCKAGVSPWCKTVNYQNVCS